MAEFEIGGIDFDYLASLMDNWESFRPITYFINLPPAGQQCHCGMYSGEV